jgi:hypothetical protein
MWFVGVLLVFYVTRIKSGPPFWKCERNEMIAVMRPSPDKATKFAAQVPPGKGTGIKFEVVANNLLIKN